MESKQDIYSVVVERISERLRSGVIPWRRPWGESSPVLGSHCNVTTQKPYQGINAVLTACSGFDSRYWASYRQWSDLGGTVQAGSKGCPIVYWSMATKEDSEGNEKRFGFIKHSYVFNLDQVSGVESIKAIESKRRGESVKSPIESIAACDSVIEGFRARDKGLSLSHGGSRAYYVPSADSVQMPLRESFGKASDYYAVLFHEFCHATGHVSRLNRPTLMGSHGFGTHEYSKEELVAEMGSAFLCGVTGIDTATLDNSAAYIDSWLKVFKHGDSKMLVQAASLGQKAADLILGLTPESPNDRKG